MWLTTLRNFGHDCQPFSISVTLGRLSNISFTAAITDSPPPSTRPADIHNSSGAHRSREISSAAPAALIKFLSGRVAPNTPTRIVPPVNTRDGNGWLSPRKYRFGRNAQGAPNASFTQSQNLRLLPARWKLELPNSSSIASRSSFTPLRSA